ncbi:MAG: polysaccharide biosynthesis protein [Clostridia bacterium]
MKSFVKGAAVLGIAGLIVKLIGAVYRIPLANIVGVNGMAYYEVAYPYYSWLLVVSSAGLPTAISKLVSERVSIGDYRGAHAVFRTAFKLLVIIGILTSLLFFFLSDPIADMSGLPAANLSFKALAPALFIASIMCAYRGYLQGLQHMTGTAVSQVVEQLGKLLVGFTLAAKLLPMGPEYAAMGALIGVSVSELMALIAIFFIYRKKKKEILITMNESPHVRSRGPSVIKQLLMLAIPITIGASIMPLTAIADSAMILNVMTDSGFSLENAMGAYSILRSNVTVFINMPAVLTMALAMSLVPAVSSKIAGRDIKGAVQASKTGMKLALIVGAPCAIGLFLFGKQIIGMLFTSLDEGHLLLAQDLMRTASIGVLFLSLVQTLTGIIQGLGRPFVPVINLVFGGILKVVTMLILMPIPSINIQGAAVSTVVCYAAAGILDTIYVIRKTRMRIDVWDVFLKPIVASLIMGGFAYITFLAIGGTHPVVGTIAAIGVSVIVYGALLVLFKMLSKEDLEFMPGGRKIRKLIYKS